ncbi:MAG: DMT family transporter [Chitinophagales bacterium]
MLPEQRRAYLILHICVFIWGFTAILGNLITLKETVLVWYRMGITSLSLMFLPILWKGMRRISFRAVLQLSGIGVLVALHWITFYGSIKYSLASVALTCLATISLFTAFLEPLMLKSKFQMRQVLLALAILPAIYLLFHFSGQYTLGIIMGLLSSLFASIFTILNKKVIVKYDAVSVTFVELGTGFLFISIVLPVYFNFYPETVFLPTSSDWIYLLILSIVCTSIPFVLSINTLRHLSAFTGNLAVNLEPVYGIIMASLLFKDHKQLDSGFYVGACIIIGAVFMEPLMMKRRSELPIK